MTDPDILALRERVAVIVGWTRVLMEGGKRPSRWFAPKGTGGLSTGAGQPLPTLAELCEPMLEWLLKRSIVEVEDLENHYGVTLTNTVMRTLLADSPALALAMAMDALGEVEA